MRHNTGKFGANTTTIIEVIELLIARNKNLHTRLWIVKIESQGRHLTIRMIGPSLEKIKIAISTIDLETYLCRRIEKPWKDTSEETSGGKSTEVPIEAERTRSNREVDLLLKTRSWTIYA